jgi:hypothetical protein
VDTPVAKSRWVQVFDGLVDENALKQEEHDEPAEQSSEQDEGKRIVRIHVCEFVSVCAPSFYANVVVTLSWGSIPSGEGNFAFIQNVQSGLGAHLASYALNIVFFWGGGKEVWALSWPWAPIWCQG